LWGRSSEVRSFIEYVVEALVDAPEQVNISNVPQGEAGKGARGGIVNALRRVARAAAAKSKR
jgi:predicted RNA-binding protein YlqC (UPF0109 family)